MTSYIGIDLLDDNWSDSNLQESLACINPSLICPTEVQANEEPQVFGNVTNTVNQSQQNQQQNLFSQQQQQHQLPQQFQLTWPGYNDITIYQPCSSAIQYQCQQQRQQQQHLYQDTKPLANIENKSITEIQFQQQQLATQQLQLNLSAPSALDQHQKQPLDQQQPFQNQFQYQYQTLIDSPPILPIQDVPKNDIQERLRQHTESARRRHERIRDRIEKEPVKCTALTLRNSSGRKMTGRERQLELEKQEKQEMRLRDHYLSSIRQLERKCSKLREILENIVTTSPDYDHQMKNFMDTEEPMIPDL